MEFLLLIFALLIIIATPVIAFKYGAWYAFLPAFVVGAILFSVLMHANYGVWGIPAALVYAGQLFTIGINGKDPFELSEKLAIENKDFFMVCIWSIYVICPLITVSAIIKFIKKRLEKTRLLFKFCKKIYVFSAKNPEAIALANDILKNNQKAVIVFSCEIGEKEIKKEIDINQPAEKIFARINRTNEVHMCFIDKNDDAVLDKLTDFLNNKKKGSAEIYVFTENETCEEVVDTLKIKDSSVHIRIADMRSATVRNILWDYPLFSNAKNRRVLTVSVIGVGAFGGCFAANALWCGIMPDCRLKLNLVDCDTKENMLQHVFRNHADHNFDIESYTADVNANNFFETIEKNNRLMASDYIMVSISNDDANVKIARDLRLFFSRCGRNPFIITYVRNQGKYDALHDTLKKEGVELTGGINNMYCENNVFSDGNFNRAFEVYKTVEKNYGNNNPTHNGFYAQQQVYINSSYASAVHCKYKIYSLMGRLDGSRSAIKKAVKENREKLSRSEHDRWTAFEILQNYKGIQPGEFEQFVRQNYAENPEAKPHKNERLKINACITDYDNLDTLADIVYSVTNTKVDFKKNDASIVDNTDTIWWA